MSSSRDSSPDWLREFKAPTRDFETLSSDSDSSPKISPKGFVGINSEALEEHQNEQDSVLIDSQESPAKKGKKRKSPKVEENFDIKEDASDALEGEPIEEDIKEKPAKPLVSSRLPLVFPDKVQRTKALVECDGDSIDLGGDVGAVGRIVISNGSKGNHEMLLDLKGTIYRSTIVPSRTFCIVSVGQSEAKIEAIMNDFIQLEPQSNVFEAETMVEGTLDGFSFDSDEEGEKIPRINADQSNSNNENGDQANKKSRKKEGMTQKKAKATVKPSKKAARKPQASRKTKKSKK
ncbi:DNA-binding protein BIN4 [Dioscorea cayenensis subsp. rotundata]|uniref:DNA-binding protein BIN4 n=1 Tax=Dioscorea cayennensis subsp. rotundata TaxID=55577 RepID=A0AB40AZ15_DIOCR|nr:DNA-binding protein BIN4 [Dioscorea cayenensis subsp. rotundata]